MKEQAIRLLGMVLMLGGIALLVYNLLGFEMYGDGPKVIWQPETRAWVSAGAVALAAGALLSRQQGK